jgi:hypothetical protein
VKIERQGDGLHKRDYVARRVACLCVDLDRPISYYNFSVSLVPVPISLTMNPQPVQSVNPNELLQVVSDATAQDPARVQAATHRLKELLELFGTFDGLQEIAAQRNLPLTLRQQAIIQFKNSALSRWRSRKSASGVLCSDAHDCADHRS